MNPEELKYYITLQEFFKEKMGEWQWYDRWYDPDDGGEVGAVLPGQVRCFRNNGYPNLIRLPLPIDPVNPERGLMGMINRNGNDPILYSIGYKWSFVPSLGFLEYYNAPTPTLAILKALAAQEGVEEK